MKKKRELDSYPFVRPGQKLKKAGLLETRDIKYPKKVRKRPASKK